VRIAQGRHIDVLEVDAASHTGVDFVRDLTDMAQTKPNGRFRVFILDEAHMLSTSAWNALLKTLEEPPPHVKFLFATTEIRKVPATVLSRCQRFDLRRIEPEAMIAYLGGVAQAEGAAIADDALALVARAAEGSMRDALSILDQALDPGGPETTAEQVRAMLGMADRGRVLDLFEAVMRGDPKAALDELGAQYADGADPAAVLRELAEVAHWLSVVKVSPEAADDPAAAASERDRGRAMAAALGMRPLARAWQMLLKALEEVCAAPNAMMAAEMALIRMTHVADLPSPDELVRRLTAAPDAGAATGAAAAPAGDGGGAGAAPRAVSDAGGGRATMRLAASRARAEPAPAPDAAQEAAPDPLAAYARFEDVMALLRARRDMALMLAVEDGLRVAAYAPGRIEVALAEGASAELPGLLARRLTDWTGARWIVSVVARADAPTIAETRAGAREAALAAARANPVVAAALAAFPGAEIRAVRPFAEIDAAEGAESEPEAPAEEIEDIGDDWAPLDPHEED
jgi:DNA polymerase-3 subunit gamma/tau